MKFTKMHGIGNDYVYVDATREDIKNPSELAIRVSDRHFGIGSDGLILIRPSDKADFMMDIYNADGSRAMMCGNGIRCVGKYVYDHGLTDKKVVQIDTLSGIKTLSLTVKPISDAEGYTGVSNGGYVVDSATVNMGAPIFEPADIPVKLPETYAPRRLSEVLREARPVGLATKDDVRVDLLEDTDPMVAIHMPMVINDSIFYGTCVSIGNPHVIIFVDETDDYPIEKIGPLIESSRLFPNRVNTEFVQVVDRGHVKMRVWERGSGETMACGTGASATAVASALSGKTDDEVIVSLLGGDLRIKWDRAAGTVYMTGPATTVFEGEI